MRLLFLIRARAGSWTRGLFAGPTDRAGRGGEDDRRRAAQDISPRPARDDEAS